MMPTILLCCWITLISDMYTRQIPIIEVAQSVVVVPYTLLLIDLPGWPALWEMISNRKRHVTFSVFITRWKKIVYKIFSTVLIARKELLFKYKFIFQRKLTSLFNETPLNLCHPCTTHGGTLNCKISLSKVKDRVIWKLPLPSGHWSVCYSLEAGNLKFCQGPLKRKYRNDVSSQWFMLALDHFSSSWRE